MGSNGSKVKAGAYFDVVSLGGVGDLDRFGLGASLAPVPTALLGLIEKLSPGASENLNFQAGFKITDTFKHTIGYNFEGYYDVSGEFYYLRADLGFRGLGGTIEIKFTENDLLSVDGFGGIQIIAGDFIKGLGVAKGTSGIFRIGLFESDGKIIFGSNAEIEKGVYLGSTDINLQSGVEIFNFRDCFPAGSYIQDNNGKSKPIETITIGDSVLAFDEDGKPVSGIVTKLFRNTTQDFLRLNFAGGRDELVVTPGHRFLTETGDYMQIGHMLRLGGGTARVVDIDGGIVEATGERIVYSAETAHLFPEAQSKSISFDGSAVLKEETQKGWATYNFEVAAHHNYVAGGVRVHNDSVWDLVPEEAQRLAQINENHGFYIHNGALVEIESGWDGDEQKALKRIKFKVNDDDATLVQEEIRDPLTRDLKSVEIVVVQM